MAGLQAKIMQTALVGVAKWITSPEAWDVIRSQVTAMADAKDLSGEEKRSLVVAAVMEAGWKWASWALNLLIEIAVVVVTAKIDGDSVEKA